MFKKVLVAEDMDSINKSLETLLQALGVQTIDHVQYCDDALLKFKKSLLDKEPYDLLISDLNFKEDHRNQKINSGEQLIETLLEQQPELKIIVFSVEDRIQKIKTLINNYHINAYVCKGRYGLNQLKDAMEEVYKGSFYSSPEISQALTTPGTFEVDHYDIELMKLVSDGLTQEEIGSVFKEKGISPSSLSSIEKRLNKLKDYFKAKNATNLVAIVKDLGLI